MKKQACFAYSVIALMLVAICAVSCSDTGKNNETAEKLPSKAKEQTAIEVYNSFVYESTVCQIFVKAMTEDQDLIKKIEKTGYRERDAFAMLANSMIAKKEIVQYVLTHKDYFFLDVDFHGGPTMIYVENSNIYCTQTDRRLGELEAFGPSAEAWKVREQALNIAVENLLAYGMPGYAGPIGYDFQSLKTEFEAAKKFYSHNFKKQLKGWMQNTALRLRQGIKNVNEDILKKSQQKEKIESWISELKKGLD